VIRCGIQVRQPPPQTGNLVDDFVAHARHARAVGLASLWVTQGFDYDALTMVACIGRAVAGLELGTAVVVTYPRHPLMLASQALTVQAACGGRLALGIGPSHASVIEGPFGLDYRAPFTHTREYVNVLHPLLNGQPATFHGHTLSASAPAGITVAGAAPCQLLLGALGARMLRLAGEAADGTVTAQVGPEALASHVAPAITAAAAAAGRPSPRVVVCLPACVSADLDGARAAVDAEYPATAALPIYRALFERQGVSGPADLAVIGDEDAVASQIRGLADAGATDFAARLVGSPAQRERTMGVLAAIGGTPAP
jgi:F420-dependent oxidoreductase-like protein